jgi:hypothetical protein
VAYLFDADAISEAAHSILRSVAYLFDADAISEATHSMTRPNARALNPPGMGLRLYPSLRCRPATSLSCFMAANVQEGSLLQPGRQWPPVGNMTRSPPSAW